MKINDKKYWSEFYFNNNELTKKPSLFAQYLVENSVINEGDVLFELGCGNGRDSIFFAKNNIDVTAVDQCDKNISLLNEQHNNISFISDDFTNLSNLESKVNVVYSRFTLHSINDEGEQRTLNWVYNNLKNDGILCVEARTLKDPIFGKGIDKGNNIWFYNNHHRRFIDAISFKNKLVEMGFEIKFFDENNGFAKHKDDDPVVLRAIVKKL
jgi:ubiquinone/menaquinone biosynthesis C-methylase UbiE